MIDFISLLLLLWSIQPQPPVQVPELLPPPREVIPEIIT